jgi:hypothetical protein
MLEEKFLQAVPIALQLHADQVRKGTSIPYMSHLMSVAALVQENGGDDIAQAAAILHDAIEDQEELKATKLILDQLGPDVFEVIMLCSDSIARNDDGSKLPWKVRKEAHIDHMNAWKDSELSDNQKRALLIMTADKLHNARAILEDYSKIGDAIYDRFKGGKEGTLWYYTECVRILGCLLEWAPITRKLDEVVNCLKGYPKGSTKVIEYHSPKHGSVYYDASTQELVNKSAMDFFEVLEDRGYFDDLKDDVQEKKFEKNIEEIEQLVQAKEAGLVPSILMFEVTSRINDLRVLKNDLVYYKHLRNHYEKAKNGDRDSRYKLLAERFNGQEERDSICRTKIMRVTTPITPWA